MKSSFFWKLTFCLVPLALAAVVVAMAFWDYFSGRGGFKLGVDLVGGTILIYEIDLDKMTDENNVPGKLPSNWKPQELATRLKTRIDPTDLYNITVRPVSDTRFEIILPTGGYHQTAAEEAAWGRLLDKVESEYPVKSYVVKVGEKIALLAAVNAQDVKGEWPVEEIRKFIDENYQPQKKLFGVALPAARLKSWQTLLDKTAEKYPPRRYVVGRGRTDELLSQIYTQYPSLDEKARDEVSKLVTKGETAGKSLTTEKIQEVKELLGQVGALEFRIVASPTHDPDALDAAKKYFEPKDATRRKEVEDDLRTRADLGQPPPRPKAANDEDHFTATGQNNQPLGRFTYSWVELSAGYRQEHGLSNPRERVGNQWKLLENPTDDERTRKAISAYRGSSDRPYSRNFLEAKQWRDKGLPFLLYDKQYNDKGEVVSFHLAGLVYSREVRNQRVKERDKEKKYEYFILTRDAEDASKRMTGDRLSSARPGPTGLEIQFNIKPEWASAFHEFTSKNVQQLMAISLDGYIESAANIESAISSAGRITGNFTRQRVEQTVRVLRAGALPATLKPEPVSESTMGPTLGADTIKSGAISVLIAFGAVMIFMLIYYRFAGFVACVALLANLLLTIAFMVVIQATFTLPGLAGLVLMLGMAVDANVLIYERLREEKDRGASLSLALRNGYERAFPTIIDTHLSSIFTAIVLWVVGNDQLKGFGISLTVGLIISLFTSLYMTWVMFDFWRAKGWLHKLSMMEMFKTPKIPFMRIRYYFFAATAILTVVGAALFIWRLDRGVLNIDFMGGTAYSGVLKQPESIGELQAALANSPLKDKSVEQIFISDPGYTQGDKSRLFTLRTSEKSVRKVAAEINKYLGPEGKNWLETVYLEAPSVDSDGKTVWFEFTQKVDDKETNSKKVPAFASRAQLSINLSSLLAELSTNLALLEKTMQTDHVLAAILRSDSFPSEYKDPKNPIKKIDWDTEAGREQLASLLLTLGQELHVTETLIPEDVRAQKNDKQQKYLLADKLASADVRRELAEKVAALSEPGEPPLTKWAKARGGLLEWLALQGPQGEPQTVQWHRSAAELETASQQLHLVGLGKEKEGRFQFMKLTLVKPLLGVNQVYLERVLNDIVQRSTEPQPEQLENFDSQLAADTQVRALYAILASWGAILLFLWFRCGSWTFGLAAVLCLIHDLFFTLGMIAVCTYVYATPIGWALGLRDFKIDLPAVAALLTLVGYSVSDTIVVFDRIREVRGKNPALTPKMIDDSVNQTLSRTLLTAATVALVVLVLYLFGGEGVHLFAFVMVVGVVVGTYSSIYIAAPLLLMFGEGGHPSATARDRAPAPQPATTEG